MADISLTASMRSNLLSLQNTQSLMDMTQERLSTGKKVNSAIDNPSSYYTAASLNNRASDLSALLDSMGQGIQTIKAANEGIEAITAFAQQAKALANTARDEAIKPVEAKIAGLAAAETTQESKITFTITDSAGNSVDHEVTIADSMAVDAAKTKIITDTKALDGVADASFDDEGNLVVSAATGYTVKITGGTGDYAAVEAAQASAYSANRVKSATQFDSILSQIDQLAADSGYKGVNLLQSNNLKVVFNEDRSSSIEVKGVNASSEGLGLSKAANQWQDNNDIDAAITAVEDAINSLRAMATDFGNNYSIIQNREDFTENLINVLTEGADKLTLADMNEESANMLALQTRQQLAVNSLSLASQAAQSVLRLF